MNFSRSTRKAISLATLAAISAIGVSACVATVSDYYEEDYYPEDRTVVVRHAVPVVQRVDVYETQPTVIVARPRPHHYRPHHYYGSPRPIDPVIIHQRPHQRPHHRPYTNETHKVIHTSNTEVKQPKKIVIESQG